MTLKVDSQEVVEAQPETPGQTLTKIKSRLTELGRMQTVGPWGPDQVSEMRSLNEERERILSSPITEAENAALRAQGIKTDLTPEEKSLVVSANEKIQFQKKKH